MNIIAVTQRNVKKINKIIFFLIKNSPSKNKAHFLSSQQKSSYIFCFFYQSLDKKYIE